MFWVTKVAVPLALVVGMTVTTVAMAEADGNQPPGGNSQPGKGFDRKKGDDKKADDKKGQPGDKRGPAPKADPAVEAWLKVLIEKITDPHDVIRDSARGAIVAVGPPAIPALQKLAEGNDAAKAVAAQKLIAAIQQQQRGDGRGPFGRGGFGPRGPMGPPPGRPDQPNPMRPGERPNPMRPGGERPGFDRLLGDLKLSEQQQKQMQEVLEVHAKKMREFAEKARAGKVERQEVMETMEKLQKELMENVKKVLNEDQFKKLQERLPGGRFPFPGPFGPGGERPGRPERPDRDR